MNEALKAEIGAYVTTMTKSQIRSEAILKNARTRCVSTWHRPNWGQLDYLTTAARGRARSDTVVQTVRTLQSCARLGWRVQAKLNFCRD
eukprot:6190055-Pleurochrysis_carterae.AAC.3